MIAEADIKVLLQNKNKELTWFNYISFLIIYIIWEKVKSFFTTNFLVFNFERLLLYAADAKIGTYPLYYYKIYSDYFFNSIFISKLFIYI